MNHRARRYHKMYGQPLPAVPLVFGGARPWFEESEAGYALVALLAVMTLLALFALAAAPSIRQQSQREQEKEAIFRGEQVADAVRAFYLNRRGTIRAAGDAALPNSIDQLLEGVPIIGGTKKRQILRPSAARDPLSESGEWQLVRPRSQGLVDFQRAVMLYAGNVPPTSRDTQMTELQTFAVPPITSVLSTGLSEPPPAEEDLSADSTGPFVGVRSGNRSSAVLYYYGIDRHNQWIFTPLFK
jgi:type II secretory pathway pseudopilin PulG